VYVLKPNNWNMKR